MTSEVRCRWLNKVERSKAMVGYGVVWLRVKWCLDV